MLNPLAGGDEIGEDDAVDGAADQQFCSLSSQCIGGEQCCFDADHDFRKFSMAESYGALCDGDE